VHRLHVPMQLRKTMASTNVIESAFSIVEQVCRNVKRWHGSDQRERCVQVGSITRLKEGITMLQAASLFNQLLQHFPRTEFASLVKKHLAERAAKGFTCWTQFVPMTFSQLAHADSLREICNGLACSEGKLVH